MGKIYAQKYNCPKEAWLVAHGNTGDYTSSKDVSSDNYQIDRDELRDKFEKDYFKDTKINSLYGSTDEQIKNLAILIEDGELITLRSAYIEHREHIIKTPYIIRNCDKMIILFLQFKELDKFFKDYNTKSAFMPKLFYTIDMMEGFVENLNLENKLEIEYKIATLEKDTNGNRTFVVTKIWNNSDGSVNLFEKDKLKNLPVYEDVSSEVEPPSCYGRNCKNCQFRRYCNIPDTSILELEVTSQCWRNTKAIIDKIGSLKIEDMGREEFDMLNYTQQTKLNAINSADGISMDKELIQIFLERLEGGYVSFDFETYSSIVPPNNKYDNYAQIPFSYSLDIVDAWSDKIIHREFILDYKDSSFDNVYKSLKRDMPVDMPIVVYFKSFEIGRFKEFQEQYPEDYDLIQSWIDNVVDLYELFEQGAYYDLRFNNSCSLKNVYPVLVDSKAYEFLDINNGEKAMLKYKLLFNGRINDEEDAKKTVDDLMKYNSQDTMAQIEIINILKKLL